MKFSLERSRENLDVIDSQIAELLKRRVQIAREIVRYKLENGCAVTDLDREQAIIDRVLSNTGNMISRDSIHKIYNLIFKEAKDKREA